MPEFAFRALTAGGAVTAGTRSAASESELEDELRREGAYLITAEAAADASRRDGDEAGSGRTTSRVRTDGRVGRRHLLALAEYLAGSLEAGIPILETLEDVGPRLESKRLRAIVDEVRDTMAIEGRSLSDALSDHPKAFSPLVLGTIRAGEATGHLDYAMSQLVDYLDWQEEIRAQIQEATRYPLLVLIAMGLLIAGLIAFVYPRLLPILTGFDVEMPWPTRLVMGVSLFLRTEWYAVLAGGLGLAALFGAVRRSERGRLLLDGMLLRIPVIGRFAEQVNMARFVTYLGLFYRTGVDLVQGLELVERLMGNRAIAGAIGRARREIVEGESLATAFGRTGHFPMIVQRSLALGETTGSLDDALARSRRYYDREIPSAVKRLTTALQPVLIVFLGAVLTIIALSFFLPIMTIYNSIGVG